MANNDIKLEAAGAGVRLWQLAERLQITDCSFSRKLRKELPQAEKDKIRTLIKDMAKEVQQ